MNSADTRRFIEELTAQLDEQERALQAVTMRRNNLRAALEALTKLLVGEDGPMRPSEPPRPDESILPPEREDRQPPSPALRIKRAKTSNLVQRAVDDADRPLTRVEIRERVKAMVPPDQWSNPDNAINTAIGRAVERRQVRQLEQDLFAPIVWRREPLVVSPQVLEDS